MRKIDRFDKYMRLKGLNDNRVTQDLGLSVGTLGKSRKENRDLSDRVIDLILKFYTDIEQVWLLTGEGEMLVQSTNDAKPNTDTSARNYTTYLLPISSRGGTLTGFSAPGTMLQHCEKIVSPIADVDFAISVYGESMSPEYPSGSTILIKKIDPNIFIDWGHDYVLDTPNGVILKRLVYNEKNPEVAICRSLNKNPEFADFEIKLSDIYGMYRVLMCLSVK